MKILLAALFVAALLAGCAYILPFPNCPMDDFYEYLACANPHHYDNEEPTEERLRELADLLDSYCVERPDHFLPVLDETVISFVPAAQATMRGQGVWAKRFEFEGRSDRLLKGDHFRALLDAYLLYVEVNRERNPGTANVFCLDFIERIDARILTVLIHNPQMEEE